MLDLVVRSDRVVTPHGVGAWDVAVQGERIVAVAEPGSLTDDVGRTIDATGKIVFPGGETTLSAGPEQVSRAALFGGTTTLLDFASNQAAESIQQTIEKRDADWKGQCYTDYAFHVMLHADIPPAVLDEIPEAIAAGFPSFKMFTTDIT